MRLSHPVRVWRPGEHGPGVKGRATNEHAAARGCLVVLADDGSLLGPDDLVVSVDPPERAPILNGLMIGGYVVDD